MSHEIDNTAGRDAMAYIGQTPWHGLGQALTPNAPLETWQDEAGLDWEAIATPVLYSKKDLDFSSGTVTNIAQSIHNNMLYRSDTGAELAVVSKRYKPVQPRDVIEFYRDLTEQYGFQLETAGALKGGRKIWALANTRNAVQLAGNDRVGGYLLLATSFDGSMATQARFTSIRVVCNNTLTIASQGKADVTVRHSTDFDAKRVKLDLRIGEGWEEFQRQAIAMSHRPITPTESVRFLLDAYLGLDTNEKIEAFQADKKNDKPMEKFLSRMQTALFNSPGAHMESARGMLWGVLNAVTYDIDHAAPARNQENRLNKAWFGTGETVKERAFARALAMV